jgi:hypothetical protein
LAHEDAFMPWKEIRTVDQRLQFLSSYEKEEMSVTDLCHEFGFRARPATSGSSAMKKSVQKAYWTWRARR